MVLGEGVARHEAGTRVPYGLRGGRCPANQSTPAHAPGALQVTHETEGTQYRGTLLIRKRHLSTPTVGLFLTYGLARVFLYKTEAGEQAREYLNMLSMHYQLPPVRGRAFTYQLCSSPKWNMPS